MTVLRKSDVQAMNPCSMRILEALWSDSPRLETREFPNEQGQLVPEQVVVFPDPWTREETVRLLKRDARAVFWLVTNRLLPIDFQELCKIRKELKEEERAARSEELAAVESERARAAAAAAGVDEPATP